MTTLRIRKITWKGTASLGAHRAFANAAILQAGGDITRLGFVDLVKWGRV